MESAMGVIRRFAGPENGVIPESLPGGEAHTFETEARHGQLIIRANTPVDVCRGFYHHLKREGRGLCCWSGNRFVSGKWNDAAADRRSTPFPYRYYLNAVTFGYTTAFWDWPRWEQEIDWMALHGINLPLALTAQEAIMARVYRALGMSEQEIDNSFCGPAHLPWLRMGNIADIDTPLPPAWHSGQIALQKKILQRMRELGMTPICPGFSGVVSRAFADRFPEEALLQLHWGGQQRFRTYLLLPQSPMFARIQKMFIAEWEREFGPCTHYLIDSFNEMPIPADLDLADYAEKVYRSLQDAHPDAVWVMQGWMFGYQRDIWTAERLRSLLSRIPDKGMLLLDLAADYTHLLWKQPANSTYYRGFFGKNSVLSYIPNMGGKTAYTGNLPFYASYHAEALAAPPSQRPIGFGFAPEGLENNEVIYELLSDAAWEPRGIELLPWLREYSRCRYGARSPHLDAYWQALLRGPYGSFTDHPRFAWQGRSGRVRHTVNTQHLREALSHLVKAYDDLHRPPLCEADLRELGAILLGAQAQPDFEWIDALLEGHPLHRLSRWLEAARACGSSPEEQNYYERSARRIITTWGPGVEDYSARLWSGLIRDYYAPRFRLEQAGADSAALSRFEDNWVERQHGLSPKPDADAALQRLLMFIRQRSD